MNNNELRIIIREEIEKALFQCHFLISYDISKLNEKLKSNLPEKMKELGGKMKNESLYCFNGGEEIKSKVFSEILTLLEKENVCVNDTVIYCVTANGSKIDFVQIKN